MPDYKCNKCGTEFKKKWNYEYHINRKNPCIGNGNLVENEKNQIENIDNLNKSNIQKLIDNTEKKEVLYIENIKVEEKEEENDFKCLFCKKMYSNTSNLNKHLKNCKIKINKEKEELNHKNNEKKIEDKKLIHNKPITIHISKIDSNNNNLENMNYNKLNGLTEIYKEESENEGIKEIYKQTFGVELKNKFKEEINNQKDNKIKEDNLKEDLKNTILKEEYDSEFIKELKRELFELKNILKYNQNGNNSNSINNHYTFLTQINQNFFINNFGKESIDSIQTDFYFNLLSSPYDSVPRLVEEIHFNQKNPNNTNIILPNQNLPFIYLYENGKWVIANKESTLNQLVDTNFERVDDFYEHYKNYLEKTIIEKYEKYSIEYLETNLKEDIQKDVSNVLERDSQRIIETIIENRRRLSLLDKEKDKNKDLIENNNENTITFNKLLKENEKINQNQNIILNDFSTTLNKKIDSIQKIHDSSFSKKNFRLSPPFEIEKDVKELTLDNSVKIEDLND